MVNIWDPICKNVYPANMYPACNIYTIQVVLLLEYMQYVSNLLDTSIPTLRFYIVSNEYESSVLYIQDIGYIENIYCIQPICI